MASLNLVTPPAVEPVNVAEMMGYLRVDPNPDGTFPDTTIVTRMIAAARKTVETMCGRALINQVWSLTLDGFPGGPGYYSRAARQSGDPLAFLGSNYAGELALPKSPLVSIASIGYLTTSYQAAILDPSMYRLVGGTDGPGRLLLVGNNQWPITGSTPGSVIVEFIAGYGPDASSVPESAILAIQGLVQHWYYPPENATDGIPKYVESLIDSIDYGGGIG